jgi:hypothetical protein
MSVSKSRRWGERKKKIGDRDALIHNLHYTQPTRI